MSHEVKHESHCKYCKELAEDCTCSRGSRLLSEQEICKLSTNPNCGHCTLKEIGKLPNIPCGQFDDKMLVAKAQARKTMSALIAWLEEPCDKHRILEDDQFVQTYISDRVKYVIRYERHRKDCPKCWQELKGGVK